MYDVIVVGGGPAGMTAALYALRNGKSVLILEKHGFGGQITYSPRVENVPGFLSVSGNELAEKMLDQVLAQGAEVELETVSSVAVQDSLYTVATLEGGRYESRAVILAVGVKHRMLGLPGEEDLVGEGISFCAVCDGYFYQGQEVCVAGGGNSALQEAILLAGKCRRVTVLQDLPTLTGEKRLQELLLQRDNVTVRCGVKLTGFQTENGALSGVTLNTQEIVPCTGLFVAIGLIPENEAFASVAALNEYGYFDSDERCTTVTPGLFVAGDCRAKSVRQVTTAAADGAIAALAACRYIDALA